MFQSGKFFPKDGYRGIISSGIDMRLIFGGDFIFQVLDAIKNKIAGLDDRRGHSIKIIWPFFSKVI